MFQVRPGWMGGMRMRRKSTWTGIGMLLSLGLLGLSLNGPAAAAGTPEEERDAIEKLRYLAARGDIGAQLELANRYDRGDGVPRDEIEAAKWVRRAAENGDVSAQMRLGALYDLGRGVVRDLEEAGKWVRRAAEQGSAAAQVALAMMYAEGRGVGRDRAEAVRWYRFAAEQGDAGAQHTLGLLYGSGRGVPRNRVEAYKWLSLAAAGWESFGSDRDRLAGRMKPSQLDQARRLAREWKPKSWEELKKAEKAKEKEPQPRSGEWTQAGDQVAPLGQSTAFRTSGGSLRLLGGPSDCAIPDQAISGWRGPAAGPGVEAPESG